MGRRKNRKSFSGNRGGYGDGERERPVDDTDKFADGGLDPGLDEVDSFHERRRAAGRGHAEPAFAESSSSSDDDGILPVRRGEREILPLSRDGASSSSSEDSESDGGAWGERQDAAAQDSSSFSSDDSGDAYELDPRVQAAAMAYDDEMSGSDVESIRRAGRPGAGVSEAEALLDEREADRFRRWGSQKRNYYDADFVDDELMSSGGEEEALAVDEEAEASRLQKERAARLADEDFGADDDDDSEEFAPTLGELVARGGAIDGAQRRAAADSSDDDSSDGGADAKDVSGLSMEEKLEIVAAQSPELLDVLDEFKTSVEEVRSRLGPLLEFLRKPETGKIATARGMGFLEAKYHLLLSYCQCIAFFVVLKIRGESTKDHPVIDQLVRYRTMLERMRPLESKLKFQIDRLVERATSAPGDGVGDTEDQQLRPNLSGLVKAAGNASRRDGDSGTRTHKPRRKGSVRAQDVESSSSGGSSGSEESDVSDAGGAYKPPRLQRVRYEGEELESARVDGGSAAARRAEREQERERRRSASSKMMRFIREEYGDAPVEERQVGAFDAIAEDAGSVADAKLELERENYEEDNFIRLQLNKEDRQRSKRLRHQREKTDDDLSRLDEFADIANFQSAMSRSRGGAAEREAAELLSTQQQREAQRIRGLLGEIGRDRTPRGGAEFDPATARQQQELSGTRRKRRAAPVDFGEVEHGDDGHLHGEEHEFYRAALAEQEHKRKRTAQRGEDARRARVPSIDDGEFQDGEHRPAGKMIEKNRGLTRARSKKVKTPHLKSRAKYSKAVSRRRGQVRAHRTAPSTYAGESSGVNIGVTRSRNLG